MSTRADAINFEPLSPTIGAIVKNIDLVNTPLNEDIKQIILQGLHEHHVLFFENQPLTPQQHRDFAAFFGDLHIHPLYPTAQNCPEVIVLDTHNDNPPDSNTWHADVTFIQTPPLGSVLLAQQVPPVGGDTLWSDCMAAYDALSQPMKAFLQTLTAEHDMTKAFTQDVYGQTTEDFQKWLDSKEKNKPVNHPVIRTHPVTGRKGIFVNESFTTKILELSDAESKTLLEFLFQFVGKPEFTVRWRWKPFDVAFWDNRLTQHYACANYLPNRRIMHRATILGDLPF